MFHLEPVGRHLVEVCTNLSCALVGAQRGRRGVSSTSSASDAGETTADGVVTLRTVECLGGCGYATVVASTTATTSTFGPDRVRPRS